MRIRRTFLLAAFAAIIAVAFAFAFAFAPAHALATTRDESVQRGKVWLNYVRSVNPTSGAITYGVPYSQSKYAAETGAPVTDRYKGWRTDCSGFVSMCWNLRDSSGRPYSSDTRSFGSNSSRYVRITPDQLQVGDMVLKSVLWGAPEGHAILFAGWVDGSHTSYWALEQTGPGTVFRTRPWGEKYYYPYRYINIEDDFHDCERRVLGNDRYSTASEAVNVSFPTSTTASVPALVVASGENWPDALGGSALAGTVKGPLLLTAKSSLPASTRAQIARLKPATVYVLGGENSVSKTTEGQIAAVGTKVVRLAGSDRYDVAALVARNAVEQARKAGRTIDTAYVATGRTFPDALAVSPVAAKTGRPVLLTDSAKLSTQTSSAIRDLAFKHVVILGGEKSVSPEVEASLKALGVTVERIAASNRYNTAVAIAHHGELQGLTWANLGIASGEVFPDALSGGCAQGQSGSLLVLTPGAALSADVRAQLAEHDPDMVRVYGGFATVPQKTRQAIADVLRATP